MDMLAKVFKLLFCFPKQNEYAMPLAQHRVWLRSILSLYVIAMLNFALALSKYGKDDLMLKVSMISMPLVIMSVVLVWCYLSSFGDKPFVPVPLNIINVWIVIASIAIWFVGIEVEHLSKCCEACGHKVHAIVGLRCELKNDVYKKRISKKYDEIMKENEKEGTTR